MAEETFITRVKPATNYAATDPTDVVRLRIGNDGLNAAEPISVPQLLHRTAKNYPDIPALVCKDENNEWHTTTYSQYRENVLRTAKAFIKLGLEAHNTVAILAFNSPEWFYSELAAIHAG